MRHRKITEEVHVAEGDVVVVGPADLEFLAEHAARSPKRRARLCTHADGGDRLHEMFLVLDRACYVRPHRHRDKAESFHVIAGEVDVLLFHEDGSLRDVVRLGDPASGKPFYHRLRDCAYHTPVVVSPTVLFHETTSGPLDPLQTEYAPWAPQEADLAAAAFLEHLRDLAADWSGSPALNTV